MKTRPWASGPIEILEHGLILLETDSDKNRRLAMLALDNCVELTLKTYLSLPTKVTGIKLSRKDYDEATGTFPSLLETFEKHARSKLAGIQIAELEWYHRLRNDLYHQGNGVTVDLDKVHAYAAMACQLVHEMFEYEVSRGKLAARALVAAFIEEWTQLSRALARFAVLCMHWDSSDMTMLPAIRCLHNAKVISDKEYDYLTKLQSQRYELVEDLSRGSLQLKRSQIELIKECRADIEARIQQREQGVAGYGAQGAPYPER